MAQWNRGLKETSRDIKRHPSQETFQDFSCPPKQNPECEPKLQLTWLSVSQQQLTAAAPSFCIQSTSQSTHCSPWRLASTPREAPSHTSTPFNSHLPFPFRPFSCVSLVHTWNILEGHKAHTANTVQALNLNLRNEK